MTNRRLAVHIVLVVIFIALTALAIWLDWGPVVHSVVSVSFH